MLSTPAPWPSARFSFVGTGADVVLLDTTHWENQEHSPLADIGAAKRAFLLAQFPETSRLLREEARYKQATEITLTLEAAALLAAHCEMHDLLHYCLRDRCWCKQTPRLPPSLRGLKVIVRARPL